MGIQLQKKQGRSLWQALSVHSVDGTIRLPLPSAQEKWDLIETARLTSPWLPEGKGRKSKI